MEEESLPLPNLQPDLLVHIFHKLPIKSIYKCKLVCKEWSSLISDPFFKSNYNPSSLPNHPLTLTMIRSKKFYYRNCDNNIPSMTYEINRAANTLVGRPQPLPSNFTSQDHVSVLGSWNGLVALYRRPGDFCLFNPYVAGKELLVHTPIDEGDENYWRDCTLNGLCHDSVNDEYKAVLSYARYFDPHSFYVVSFKDGSWKLKVQLELQKLDPWIDIISNKATIVEGVPHWHCNNASNGSIFYFDPKTEDFRLAPEVPNEKRICGLGTLDGRLTASIKTDGGLEVWSLKEHGNEDGSWSMLFVIVNKLRSLSTISWMVKEVEVLIDVNGEELMIYNVRDRSLRQLQRRMKRSLHNIVAYIPTLISPM